MWNSSLQLSPTVTPLVCASFLRVLESQWPNCFMILIDVAHSIPIRVRELQLLYARYTRIPSEMTLYAKAIRFVLGSHLLSVILVAVAANLGMFCETNGSTSELHVPRNVTWFIPDTEGWLCDYNYVFNKQKELVLKLVPRNEGLGKILVYKSPPGQSRLFNTDPRYGHINSFYSAMGGSYGIGTLTKDSEWLVVAVNHWGALDRMFPVRAYYGDSVALVRLATDFTMGQEIPLNNNRIGNVGFIGHVNFPGIDPRDEFVVAYI